MTPRKSPSTNDESHLSRADIELLSSLKGGMDVLVKQVNSLQTNVRNQTEDMRKDHNEQMKTLNTKVTSLETYQATHLNEQTVIRWNDNAEWGERFKEKLALLLTIGLFVFSIVSAVIGWSLNTLLVPLLQGVK